ncbi:MAG: imidazole glycerol phosphate synthase subunit HisF, partial [Lentisphaeria bacterium]|nr:imidazole glycerol phosphate synthase subunit HisF [Lentisphaeria bacterium]
ELVFYDITASAERRKIDLDMVKDVAQNIRIPFSVGGGIADLNDMYDVLLAGSEKVSVNSLAVSNPEIIAEGSKQFGAQCIVLGMDPVKTDDLEKCPSGYEITTRGFREFTGIDALEWAKRCEDIGVGEIVVNSVDADGTRAGYEIQLTAMIAAAVSIPVVASGGAGVPQHLVDVFNEGHADAAIIASMVHTGDYSIRQIKDDCIAAGISIRKKW